jgi:hypothetical protein
LEIRVWNIGEERVKDDYRQTIELQKITIFNFLNFFYFSKAKEDVISLYVEIMNSIEVSQIVQSLGVLLYQNVKCGKSA